MTGDLVPTDPVEVEIASIQRDMSTNLAAYFRDEGKQQRYRDLLGQRRPEPVSTILAPPVPIFSADEYRAEGGAAGHYGLYLDLSREAADVALAVPDDERAAFTADFEALPEDVSAAALAVLVDRRHISATSTPEQVQTFASEPAGAEMVKLWGDEAPRRLGVLRERLWRVHYRLDDAGSGAFTRWFDGLSEAAAGAVYRKLAA
jgi:hypothetical protein